MQAKEFLKNYSNMSPHQRLEQMVSVLVGPEGCPWDQKQTAESIIDYVIDEAHELKQALLEGRKDLVTEELGDFLFTVEFLKQRLTERAPMELASTTLVEKMVRRHPHVFGDTEFATEAELKQNWEREKRQEKEGRHRFDEDIPASLAPMRRATKVLSRAMNAGFRYLKPEDALDKVWEELWEVEGALHSKNLSSELGDLLLSVLTLAKMSQISPETALVGAASKLCDRLESLEKRAGKPIQEIPHSELGPLYQEVKGERQQETAFFNYCGVSPWPRPVRTALRRASQNLGSRGLPAALELLQKREELKPKLLEFCGAPKSASVCLVPNISTAALGVAYAQDWQSGDKMVLGRTDFPANTVPWRAAADTFEVEVVWFDEDLFRTDQERAWQNLTALFQQHRPRLLALSAVSFWSGFRLDLEKLTDLCHKHSVRLFIDAIQALGNTPFRCPAGLHYLAGGSHKAMLCPEGAGFLLVGEEAAADWQPRMASWLSLPDPVEFLAGGRWMSLNNESRPRAADPTTLSGGSLNSLGYAGLEAALEFLGGKDLRAEFLRIQALQDPLEAALTQLGFISLRATQEKNRSGILSFRPPSNTDLPSVQAALAASGVSVGIPNGTLRFGFHLFNDLGQVERVIRFFQTA